MVPAMCNRTKIKHVLAKKKRKTGHVLKNGAIFIELRLPFQDMFWKERENEKKGACKWARFKKKTVCFIHLGLFILKTWFLGRKKTASWKKKCAEEMGFREKKNGKLKKKGAVLFNEIHNSEWLKRAKCLGVRKYMDQVVCQDQKKGEWRGKRENLFTAVRCRSRT